MIHVADAAELILLAARASHPDFRLVNGGTGQRSSVRDIAEALVRRLAPETRLIFSGKVREGDPRNLVADVRRLATLGFQPHFDLERGLDTYVEWRRGITA